MKCEIFLVKEKEALPSLKTGRYTHGCGSYKDNEGNTVRGIEQKIINDGVY